MSRPMNYIQQLNTVFYKFSEDQRINPTHISLYMAFFQYWNIYRFPTVYFINRQEIMQMAKLGSKTTYHRCIQQLDDWGYITYYPSNNPFKGSQIQLINFCTTRESSYEPSPESSSKTSKDTAKETSSGKTYESPTEPGIPTPSESSAKLSTKKDHGIVVKQDEAIDIKNSKQDYTLKDSLGIFQKKLIQSYFQQEGYHCLEGDRFYDYYRQRSWKIGNEPIRDWKALARKWMQRSSSSVKTANGGDHLKTRKQKRYDEPL